MLGFAKNVELHLQVEVLDQAHILGGILSLCIVYAERLDGVCRSLATEGHEDALGLASLDRYNNRLPCGKKPATGGTDSHVVSAVIRDDHREFALRGQQAGSAACQLIKTERVGMAGHGTRGIRTLQRVLEEGGIAENGIEEEFRILNSDF